MAGPTKRLGPAKRGSVDDYARSESQQDRTDYKNMKEKADFYPNSGGKGNRTGASLSSSSMPKNGKKDFINNNGTIDSEPSRQVRLGRDVTNSSPQPRKPSTATKSYEGRYDKIKSGD